MMLQLRILVSDYFSVLSHFSKKNMLKNVKLFYFSYVCIVKVVVTTEYKQIFELNTQAYETKTTHFTV